MCSRAEEAAAEAEAQRLRHFRLILQRGIVELQFFQRIAQRFVLVGLHRKQSGEHLRLNFLEARQRTGGRLGHQGDGIAHLGILQFLDTGNHETHLPGRQRITILRFRRKHPDMLGQVLRPRRHEQYLVLGLERAVHDAHQHHHADIVVEPRVDDQRLQRRIDIAFGRRHFDDQRLQHIFHTHAGLGRTTHGILRADADHIFDFGNRVFRIGGGQVDLVQHRHHLDAQVQRGVAIGHGLRLDPLRSIHHQQRAFAGRKRTRNFIREIHMPRRVDEVKVVHLPVARLVAQRGSLRLDGDATLALDVHRVQHLLFHLAIGQAAAQMDDAVCQCGFAVVDVGDDGEITDMLHEAQN